MSFIATFYQELSGAEASGSNRPQHFDPPQNLAGQDARRRPPALEFLRASGHALSDFE
jgi:hypothetical protein